MAWIDNVTDDLTRITELGSETRDKRLWVSIVEKAFLLLSAVRVHYGIK